MSTQAVPLCPVSPGATLSRSSLPCVIPTPRPVPVQVLPSQGSSSAVVIAVLALVLACVAVALAALALQRARSSSPAAAGDRARTQPHPTPWPVAPAPVPRSPGNGIVSADLLVHHEIAGGYRHFVEQRLRDLAEHICDSSDPRTVALRVAELSRTLFAPTGPDEAGYWRLVGAAAASERGRAQRVLRGANEVYWRIAETGDRVRWDYAPRAPRRAADLQHPWGPCDPDAPVAFVVTPAYTVEDRIFSPQQVYTEAG